jgi:putative transposase
MPREPRQFVPGGVYHVFSRGSNRQAIFAFDSDRIDFIDCLARAATNHDVACLAYCLMPNHYHLVLQAGASGLSNAMKALNGRYSLRFNQRHGRDAHLFKNRFGAVLQTTDEQIIWTLRYTARNPVESRLCAHPDEWRWSSYRATVGLDKRPAFLDVRALLRYFGDRTDVAIARYRELATMRLS